MHTEASTVDAGKQSEDSAGNLAGSLVFGSKWDLAALIWFDLSCERAAHRMGHRHIKRRPVNIIY